jgi:hypothetical protein
VLSARVTLTALSELPYTKKVLRVDAPHLREALSCDGGIMIWRHDETPGGEGRLAQLVRAPALHHDAQPIMLNTIADFNEVTAHIATLRCLLPLSGLLSNFQNRR